MQVDADLHIHSRYSKAVSKAMTVPNLAENARFKGLGIVGTGDILNPKWEEELLKYAERIGGYVGESGGPTRLNISSQPPNSSLERAIPELNRLGLEHFGFHVDDLESEMARFEAEGIRVILPLTVTPQGIKLAYIEGPDDVVIELVQAAP